MCVATSVAVTAVTSLQPISTVTLKDTQTPHDLNHHPAEGGIQHHQLFESSEGHQTPIIICSESVRTSAALLPVLGPSLSNTLGLLEGVDGLVVLLVVVLVLLLLSDMVLEFSTVTFRLILDILQDCKRSLAEMSHLHYFKKKKKPSEMGTV